MTYIESETTGETLTFTDDQLIQMEQTCPDEICRDLYRSYVQVGQRTLLPVQAFHYICWLACRVWLGIFPQEDMQA